MTNIQIENFECVVDLQSNALLVNYYVKHESGLKPNLQSTIKMSPGLYLSALGDRIGN